MSGTRRKFTPAYRREAAHLVIDTGRTIAVVAREIGVGEQLLGRWVAVERSGKTVGPSWRGCGWRTRSCGWIGSS
jgi:transposase-like protein